MNEEELKSKSTFIKKILKTIYLGISFCIIFSTFLVSQQMVGVLFIKNDIGFISLIIIYICYSISSILSPIFVKKLGLNNSFGISSFSITLYICSIALYNEYLILITSFIGGFGFGLIWVCEGVYIKNITMGDEESIGVFISIFYALYLSNGVIGSSLVEVFFKFSDNMKILFSLLTVLSIPGVIMLYIIPEANSNIKEQKEENFLDSMKSLFRNFKNPYTLLLIPYMIFTGISISFSLSQIPVIVGIKELPLVIIFYGVSNFIGSFLFGVIFDKTGSVLLIFYNTIFLTFAYLFIYLIEMNYYCKFFAGILLGLSDSLNLNLIQCIIVKSYKEEDTPYLFSIFNSIYSIFISLGILYSVFIHIVIFQITNLIILLFSSSLVIFLEYKNFVNKKQNVQNFNTMNLN
jgi:predicted MFS family arabinose efflux permease